MLQMMNNTGQVDLSALIQVIFQSALQYIQHGNSLQIRLSEKPIFKG